MSRLDAVVRAFDPERLTVARQLNQLTKSELASAIDVTSSALSQYERGTSRPTGSTLAKLALKLGVHPEFFMKELPLPDAGEAHFRSLRSSTKAERAQAVAEAFLLWDMVRVFQQHVRLPAVEVPHLPLPESATRIDIESTALNVRAAWGLPDGPVGNVVRQLERHGVVVTRLAFASRRLDAFSIELGDRPFVILGADKGDAARSRLDAAHELGHLVIHDDVEPGDGIVERQAHQFAAAFLMPAEQVRQILPSRFDLTRLIDLKHQWGVSIAALLYRARELGVMTDAVYRRAVTFMSAQGYRVREPAPIGSPEHPVLLERCLDALREAGVGLDAIANAVRVPVDRVERLLAGGDLRQRIHVDD